MKLSELLKRLEAIRSQFGELDVCLVIGFDYEHYGDLTRLEVEERTTLNLISAEGSNQSPTESYEPDYWGAVWE